MADHDRHGTKQYPEGPLADLGDKLMDMAGKALARALMLIAKGFFLTAGGLLAWGLFNYLTKFYS